MVRASMTTPDEFQKPGDGAMRTDETTIAGSGLRQARKVFRPILGLLVLLFLSFNAFADESGPPTLAIGADAPQFCLPGTDGKTHCLKDYDKSKILVIAFICNHCPTSQLYETPR